MFVIYDKEKQRIPIKVWGSREEMGDEVLEQALHLANLPFAKHWVALMPDYHLGYGIPIGGVVAAKEAIMPYGVGLDIGCGMSYVQTTIPARALKEAYSPEGSRLVDYALQKMMEVIPVGVGRIHQDPQDVRVFDGGDRLSYELAAILDGSRSTAADNVLAKMDTYRRSMGTLGSGNHFVEIQETESGHIALMVHSGSRNFGAQVCTEYNRIAKDLNERYFSQVPSEWNLAFLPTDDPLGQEYIRWMKLAVAFASENRRMILDRAYEILSECVDQVLGITASRHDMVNAIHNYAALESHRGEHLWVHRKGAILARKGTPGIIPGAMGRDSYLVEGMGSEESFHTASHGAGRKMSRKKAAEMFSPTDLIGETLSFCLATPNLDAVVDEHPDAYKDIRQVMDEQPDLVRVTGKLRTVGVLKG